MLKISIMVQICVYDEKWKIKIEFFQVCCPKDENVLFPNEWKKFKENHTDAKLRQHEIEILIRQSNEYEYYYGDYEYEYEAVNTFQPCNEPLQCVSADNCRSGFDFYLQIFHWFLKLEFGSVPIFFISVDRSTKIPPTFCGLDSRSNNYKVCCEKTGQPLPKPDPIQRFIPLHTFPHFNSI